MTFYLQHNDEGRVVLDTRLHAKNTHIRDINASSWREARETIHEFEFDNVDGYGWFLSKGR